MNISSSFCLFDVSPRYSSLRQVLAGRSTVQNNKCCERLPEHVDIASDCRINTSPVCSRICTAGAFSPLSPPTQPRRRRRPCRPGTQNLHGRWQPECARSQVSIINLHSIGLTTSPVKEVFYMWSDKGYFKVYCVFSAEGDLLEPHTDGEPCVLQ